MIGQRENAVKTLARIFAVSVQGVIVGLCLMAMGVVLIPITSFIMAKHYWRISKNRRLATKVCFVPLWMVMGCWEAILGTFVVFWRTITAIRDVVVVEWKAGYLVGNPLKPNGQPWKMPTNRDRAINNLAVTIGVLKDYNAEAREHGQGIPIDEEKF